MININELRDKHIGDRDDGCTIGNNHQLSAGTLAALLDELAAHRSARSTVLAILGNVEHKGGGPNAAAMYADMLNDIRRISAKPEGQ